VHPTTMAPDLPFTTGFDLSGVSAPTTLSMQGNKIYLASMDPLNATNIHIATTGAYTTGLEAQHPYPAIVPTSMESGFNPQTMTGSHLSPAPANTMTSGTHNTLPVKGEHIGYPPYLGKFSTSEDARNFRKTAAHAERKPYKHPASDPTIEQLKSRRLENVKLLYEAMTRTDAAKDNAGSLAMKRWVLNPHYEPDIIEAYCHKIFVSYLRRFISIIQFLMCASRTASFSKLRRATGDGPPMISLKVLISGSIKRRTRR